MSFLPKFSFNSVYEKKCIFKNIFVFFLHLKAFIKMLHMFLCSLCYPSFLYFHIFFYCRNLKITFVLVLKVLSLSISFYMLCIKKIQTFYICEQGKKDTPKQYNGNAITLILCVTLLNIIILSFKSCYQVLFYKRQIVQK